jgi:dephospho-CoA kinase
MTTNKIIIGFVGLLASGKGTSATYLGAKHKAGQYRFSSILGDILTRLYLPKNRDNLIKLSEAIRTAFGDNILAETIANDAVNDQNNIIIIDGIRRLGDIEKLKNLENFVLVEIFADSEKRYNRLVERKEKTDDATKTYEEFLADHKRSTEISINDVLPLAKERIDNNGSFEELYSQLDALLKKYADKN